MRRIIASSVATAIAASFLLLLAPTAQAAGPYRAFPSTSYWNTPLPADAPVDPASAQIIEWIKADNDYDDVRLAGTTSTGEWGQPFFWADAADPVYNVVQTRYTLPPEFKALRIPSEVRADPTVDGEVTIYDLDAGYVSTMHRAVYDPLTDTWSAGGASLYYLGSNGLDGKLPQSNESRNFGHRGLPPNTYAVRYDEIQAGVIDHVLKVAVDTTKAQNVFPMTGHESGTTAEFAPPEGARLRIKPSVNLQALGLTGPALTIAVALQRYGAIVGDQSGGNVTLKVENTIAEGRGFLWSGLLTGASLSRVPLDMFEVVRHGYIPPAGTTTTTAPAPTTTTTPAPTTTTTPAPAPTTTAPTTTTTTTTTPTTTTTTEPVASTTDPVVEVVAPRTKIKGGRKVNVAWDSTGGEYASVAYRLDDGSEKIVADRTEDDGKFTFKLNRKLRGERLVIDVKVWNAAGDEDADSSNWLRVR